MVPLVHDDDSGSRKKMKYIRSKTKVGRAGKRQIRIFKILYSAHFDTKVYYFSHY